MILLLEQQFNTSIAPWVKDRLQEFQRLDQQSDLFRYADLPDAYELWIDFHHLKLVMDRLTEAFDQQLSKAV